MKKIITGVVAAALAVSMFAGCSSEKLYTAGTYTGEAQGFGGKVSVTITTDAKKITKVESTGENETPAIGGAALATLDEAFMKAQSAEFDGVSGATLTSNGYKEAAANAIALAKGEELPVGEVKFTPGTYEGSAQGYGSRLTLSVTFTEDSIENIEVVSHKETDHVGTPAFDIVIPEIIEYTSTGVDGLAGATVTSTAIKAAVNDAAEQAGCEVAALQKGKIEYVLTPGEAVEETYDVVIVGAGGAGMTAAAEAAQQGKTVAIIEKNADIGGNTVVSGCSFQAWYPYQVWDPENPDATTGVCEYDGKTYEKTKADLGTLTTLRIIENWSEEPFDEEWFKNNDYTTGDVEGLAPHGVHAEYLDTLKTLKAQIKDYLAWADAKIAAGTPETELTVFSTPELHIFQSYYGGLRSSFDGSYWIYPEYSKIAQVVNEIPSAKEWLADQGTEFNWSVTTGTLIGCMWQRINRWQGGVVNGVEDASRYGAYFAVPLNTVLTANEANKLYTRTTANELIVENGKVTGVKATSYDGTEMTFKANDGVILATGGFGDNIDMVLKYNEYWDPKQLTADVLTTNRNCASGDGIIMAQAVGADTVGMGFTQLMPLGWAKDGKLAGGTGSNVIFISPEGTENAGKRFVDESAERDVLSRGQLNYGGKGGLTIQLMNKSDKALAELSGTEMDGKEYFMPFSEVAEFLNLDADTLKETVTTYDKAYLDGNLDRLEVKKSACTATILNYNENGEPDMETVVSVRYLAPSTHHTMGGLVVDDGRRVINTDGKVIDGLYAAGEVTGGYFGGNRLGGNAISEIFVSGRTAAQSVIADAK